MTGALLGGAIALCQLLGLALLGYLFRTDRNGRDGGQC